jgi:DNA-binding XRE family transcriptional regulator
MPVCCTHRLAGKAAVKVRGWQTATSAVNSGTMCFMQTTNYLRHYRHEQPLTQAELAALVGVTHACVSKIERGQRAAGWRTRKRLASALGVLESDLFPS